jgi:nucleoside-diphosphate-sugar epimerase
MRRVLVTGGAGFIGSHLIDRLVIDNEVVVLDDLSGGTMENINHRESI